MQVLDKGLIGLEASMGNDRTIARAAWVSYAKQDDETKSDEDVEKLINFLMRHKHGTPFEHVVFTFHIKAPFFVAREWFRHRIGSYNEVSARYKTLPPDFYLPEEWRVKGSTNKQGSILPDQEWLTVNHWDDLEVFERSSSSLLTGAYKEAYNSYLALLGNGVANELARMTLPMGMYTEWWWTVNLRSLFNFMNLRSSETAQWEIRQYSEALESIVQEQLPLAYKAWINNGKNAT